MSVNLQHIKRLLEQKIQSNQQKEAMHTVLMDKLKTDFNVKDLKAAKLMVNQIIKKREELEVDYEERITNLEKEIKEHGLIRNE